MLMLNAFNEMEGNLLNNWLLYMNALRKVESDAASRIDETFAILSLCKISDRWVKIFY